MKLFKGNQLLMHTEREKWHRIYAMLPFLLVLLLVSATGWQEVSAQEVSLDNQKAQWTDDVAWTDGSAPAMTGLNTDVSIYGTISSPGSLDFNNGDLTISDTLLIFGNLTLGTNSDLTIINGGVLIVYGNYTSQNKVSVIAGGYIIVTGDFTQNGSDNQGSFDVTTGSVFLLGDNIDIKDSPDYVDLTCTGDWPDECGYGNEEDLSGDGDIWEFFESGSYSIDVSGPLTFCDGDSVILSVIDDGTWYQWYQDSLPLSGENTFQYTAKYSGEYYLRMLVSDTLSLVPVNVTVNTPSTAPTTLILNRNNVCQGDGSVDLSYIGGSLGTGATAEWYDDSTLLNNIGSGSTISVNVSDSSVIYYVRFEGPCNITAAIEDTLIVYPLPETDFAGLISPVCEASADILLTGNYAPDGVFIGSGITDNGDGTAHFSPANPGTFDIRYYYTNVYSCSDTATQTITVNPLPLIDFGGLISPVCISSDSFLLSGNYAPDGQFYGSGIFDNGNGTAYFNPDTSGTYEISYYSSDLNGCTDTITKIAVINPLPVLSVSGLEADYCFNSVPDTIQGNFPGGEFFGANITDLSGGIALFESQLEGLNDIYYTYTDSNACFDTVAYQTIVYPLPIVSFSGLDSIYDISDPLVDLTAVPSGGFYTGRGISGEQYIPSLAGTGLDTVVYHYTDLQGCIGTDTIITDIRDYDFKAGARIIQDINNWCSAEAVYRTTGATPDESAGSCWINGPNFNRWFKFQATATGQVKVEVKTGGSEGTLRYPYTALWDEAGNQLSCQTYYNDYGDIIMGAVGLNAGEWYYISVDNSTNLAYRGTFSLCVDDQVDYDFFEGAHQISHFNDWCSADAEFSTLQASPDQSMPGCWPNGPNFNRWFKFQATTEDVTIDIKVGGTEGSMRRALVGLYDESLTQLGCARYESDFDDIKLGYSGLTPGNWYYITVDNHSNIAYRGTFTICLDNEVDYDFKRGAIEVADIHNWCSDLMAYSTVEGTPDGIRPTAWNTGPNYNRWFKFRASTNQLRAILLTGGVEGTLRYGYVAIWDSAGTEVASARYRSEYHDVVVSSVSLVPGELYYLSVDNYANTGYRGSFSLCITDSIDYDYKEGAKVLDDIDNYCSADMEFSTFNATADGDKGSIWPNGPNYNRWFTFTATTTQLVAQLKTGGTEGSLRYGLIAVWDTGNNEVASARYYSEYADVLVTTNNLIAGDTYYISVDNIAGLGYRGSFTLCVDDTLDYDFKEAAVEFNDLDNWCSDLKQYSTINATPDGDKGSLWPNGPNFNRWFKFQAPKPFVKVELKTGGEEGSLRYGMMALWDSIGTELSSVRWTSEYSDMSINYASLTPGEWYFVSVDNSNNIGYRGTFTMCITDTIDYDFKEAALEITDLDAWCSPEAAYTTIGATPDRVKGSNWYNGPNFNRWFKFRATSNMIKADIKTGGTEGTLRYPFIAIFNEEDVEVASARYLSDYSDISVSSDSLTIGDWYYIAVDNSNNTGYRGTFSLCVNDTIDYDFRSAAIELTDLDYWCSAERAYTTIGATPDEIKGTAWNTGPNFNRWFKFQANSTMIKADVKTGGTEGTLRYPYIAIFNEDLAEVASTRYTTDYNDISASSDSLTIGNWYYIAVDNSNNTGYQGSFTLCVADTIDYDFKMAAIEITNIDNWCSAERIYTTVGATPDELKGTAWNTGPNYNRWFKFTAVNNMVNVQLKTGGTEGTLRYPYIALWDSAGNEVGSKRYTAEYSDINVSSDTISPGKTYFISVDNSNNLGYRGTFSLCIDDTIGYDFKSGAYEISDYSNWCSSLREFSTLGATPDEYMAACWTSGPNYNRWFTFVATGTEVTVKLLTGGTEGSLRYPFIAIWDSAGNELGCKRYISEYSDLELTSNNFDLVPGQRYYITVDNVNNAAYPGTFSLCIEDVLSYDFKDGAQLIPNLNNWCSELATFETLNATPDESRPVCWPNGPTNNRWFRFQATGSSVSFMVKTFGIEGTADYLMAAIRDESLNEISCKIAASSSSDVEIYSNSLNPGDWYYLSVDNQNNTGYRGSFTVCATDHLINDEHDNAILIDDFNNWCSGDAAFTNSIATADEVQGSCWSAPVNRNVWFRFIATSPNVTFTVKSGSLAGNMVSPQIALWDNSGNEVACAADGSVDTTVLVSNLLIPGELYYLSVNDNGSPGTFTLCVDDDISYDYPEGALELSDIDNWCSPDAVFSNASATNDLIAGSCWTGVSSKNVWFKFKATGPEVKIQIKTGGIFGNMQRQQVGLWNIDGVEAGCSSWKTNTGIVVLQSDSLIAGNWYWIGVDDDNVSGSFTLCMDDSVDYDFRQNAFEITNPNGWCSSDAQFSNYYATPDHSQGSCWLGTANKNVWFKFQADTKFITIDLKTGGVYGNIRRPQMSLWSEDGNEVACIGPVIDQGTLRLTIDTLQPGNWYYVSVDDNNTSQNFTLCFNDQPTYDYKEGAIEITDISNWCSTNAAYTNYYATADRSMGSCWLGTENKNVWFKFQATTSFITADLKTGNVYGNIRRPQMALWNEDDVEVACIGPVIDQGTNRLTIDTLIPGNWYYLSVDDNLTSQNFTLCFDDQPTYDYKEGAVVIPDVSGWCSANAAYTNFYATPDQSMGSCWAGTVNKNVWFKFQATTRFMTVDVRTGTVYGSMRYAQAALWNEDGVEVACIGPVTDQGTTRLTTDTLIPGNWYYLSVDDNTTSQSFSLCFDDQPTYDYKEGAIEITDLNNWCSPNLAYTNFYATPDQSMGSCWLGTVNKNVWFKFQATTKFITADLKTGTIYGNIRRPQMALWNEDGIEVACIGPVIDAAGTIRLTIDTLIPGKWYYLSVDDNLTSQNFTLCFDDQPTYDYKEGAVVIPDVSGWCSANAAYTNFYATPDQSMGSCWAGTVNKNVWFKFQATTRFMTADVRTGTVYGSMRYAQAALWNEDGVEVACIGPVTDQGTTRLTTDTLIPGNWYYLSVDDNTTSQSFSLCFDDQPTYDYKEGAIEITDLNNWCSPNLAYTNFYATPDQSMGSCWLGTVNKNVWFKFQATTKFITADLKTGTIYGNIRRPQMALWNEDGIEVACIGPIVDMGTNRLTIDTLIPGNWYYLSVDDNLTSQNFTLCFNDQPTYDYKEGAYLVEHDYGYYPDGGFSNFYATPDQSPGTCWTGSVNKNVWFRFQAVSEEVKIMIRTGTIYGAMQRQQVALWNETGDELGCSVWTTSTGTVMLQNISLEVGEWYYISVDDDNVSNNFTLYIDDEVDYDYREGAIDLTDISDWCSAEAAYTNYYATPDRVQGSCWTGAVNKNVWFTFIAENESAIIDLKTGGVYGTMQRQQLALWNEDGVEVGCSKWITYTGTVRLTVDTLTEGMRYYISVDDDRTIGSFSLCIQGNPLSANISGTNVTCSGAADGTVTVVANGGTETGYTYSWTKDGVPMATTLPNLENLESAVYQVQITDNGDGSFITRSYTVMENPALSLGLISVDESCAGISDGSVSALAGGGTSTAYFYNWYRNGSPTGDVVPDISGLNPGWYKVIVTDAGATSCTIQDSVEIVTVGLLSLNPDSIDITNEGACVGISKILTVAGGSLGTGANWKWYLDAGLTISAGPDGISLTVNPAINTTYWVRAEGNCNNTTTVQTTISVALPSTAPASASTDRNNICPADGTVILSYTGGTPGTGATAEWYDDAALTNNIGSGNNLSIPVAGATKTYYVRFEGDCNTTAAASVTLTVTPLPVPVISGPSEICGPGTGVFTTADNAGNSYSWSLTGGGTISGSSTGNEILVEYDTQGLYGVTVTETSPTGCVGTSAEFTTDVKEKPEILEIQSDNELIRR